MTTWFLASSWWFFPAKLGEIFYVVVLPILLLAGVGYVLQRRLGLDLATLTRLNFYFVIPGIVYSSLVRSQVSGREVLTVVQFGLAMVAGLTVLALLAARLRRLPADQRNILLMTTIFYNSGNYGLPLQRLAFMPFGAQAGEAASALQVFVMIVQNVSNFTLGVILAASGRKDRHWRENLLHILKFPPLYALAAALITVIIRRHLGHESSARVGEALRPFWEAIGYVGQAMIPIALCTLGAQLAAVRGDGHRYPVKLSVLMRLLVGPALGVALVYALRIDDPLLRQILVISTSTPTAVNCMLLCMEFQNHGHYTAQAVFYSTLLSPITVTLTIFLAQGHILPGF